MYIAPMDWISAHFVIPFSFLEYITIVNFTRSLGQTWRRQTITQCGTCT